MLEFIISFAVIYLVVIWVIKYFKGNIKSYVGIWWYILLTFIFIWFIQFLIWYAIFYFLNPEQLAWIMFSKFASLLLITINSLILWWFLYNILFTSFPDNKTRKIWIGILIWLYVIIQVTPIIIMMF